ncbi:histone acetyltransferase type B catalytic subunit-like isoform X1 [Portunus trituberculatus]|uniref:histone acetyltransferase type B catalytic subunit-like isoform X1 n=2 Tax=Portunus trituberculatus TaxID=210409 RepID=UPI001E1D0843|nr:histone acetyltransferase type B catalytic subunit-like isoform X1 [Portunus trituberculatus]
MAGMSVIAKNSLQYYVVDSNEALEFKLVRKPDDLENEDTTFKPDMSHQVFGDSEQIFGYSGLHIKLYYSAARLTTYLTHTYTDKVHPEKFEGIKPDEVIKPVAEKIPPGYITNLDDFLAALQKDASFVPFGDLERRFTARTAEEGKERTFEVYRCSVSTPGFLPYHENFQTFILWYIDAASYIDVDDDKWRFFVTYEKYEVDGRQQYAFTGYTTVYEYYAYPANVRPRISQMLVLPPFQRMGLGAEMLNTIYSNYQSDSRVLDITVEDPSENFARLRDFVDAKNCLTLDSFSKTKLTEGFCEAMVTEARKKLKLNKRQVRKIYEILRLHFTNRADEKAYRQYRLEVKNRLNVQYKKEDRDMEKLKKILKPEEFTATMSITSREQRLESLERQYSELEEHYLKVLERLALS